ncbi:DUF397 domain-containing protein [Actinomadura sp. WMMA1423]|uniref:DUF397 domain-containing protein n=1 Tax=Actinomadura sp. WMMA1423 TaxID=2591108 RepID=UPI001146B47C|nr:DUF397 domain-containing protein [Actinomadura sp. WMMA1423]
MTQNAWRKSSYSSSQGDNCVELVGLGEAVGIRDSKAPDEPELLLTRETFRALIANLKHYRW